MMKISKQIRKGKLSYEETVEALIRNPTLLVNLSKKTKGLDKIISQDLIGERLLEDYMQDKPIASLAESLTRFSKFGVKKNPELARILLKEDNRLLLSTRALRTKENAMTILRWENENKGVPGKGVTTTLYRKLPRRLKLSKDVTLEAVANPIYGGNTFKNLNILRQTKDMVASAYKNKTLEQCQRITTNIKGFRFTRSLPTIVKENPLYVFNEQSRDRVKSSTRLMRQSKFNELVTDAASKLFLVGFYEANYPDMVKEMTENLPQRKIRVDTAIDMAKQMGASIAGDTSGNISQKDKAFYSRAMENFYNTLRKGDFNYEGKTPVGKFIDTHIESKSSKLGLFLVDNNPDFITKIHDNDLTPKMVKSVATQKPHLLLTLADRTEVNEKTQRTMMRQVAMQIKSGANVNENMDLLAKMITSEKQGNAFNIEGSKIYDLTAKRTMAKVVKENPALLTKIDVDKINPEFKDKFVKIYEKAFKKNSIAVFENCINDINVNKNTDAFRTIVHPLLKDNPKLIEEISEKYRNLPEIIDNVLKLDKKNQLIKNGQNAQLQQIEIKQSYNKGIDSMNKSFSNAMGKTLGNIIKSNNPTITNEEIHAFFNKDDALANFCNKCMANPNIDMKEACASAVKEMAGIDITSGDITSKNGRLIISSDRDNEDSIQKVFVDELSDKEMAEANLTEKDYQQSIHPRDPSQNEYDALSARVNEANDYKMQCDKQMADLEKIVQEGQLAETQAVDLQNNLLKYQEIKTRTIAPLVKDMPVMSKTN